jgi:hypothetical protein
MTWERWGAVSGLAALAVAGAAVAFERATPDPDQSPAEVVAFYTDHRAALLAQSLLFVLSAGIFLWFLAALCSFLSRVDDRLSPLVLTAGLAWILLSMAVQAPQIALARTPGLPAETVAVVNDVGLALATISDVPVAVLTVAVGVLAFRAGGLPRWLGWLSAVAAAAHLIAWFGVIADTGPVAPGGWVTFVVYPVFVAWLVAVITVMIRHPAAG